MSKGENIVKWIKGQRISWLGHLERMEENRMPTMIFSQELRGTRRRGRPRKRWKEQVERDLQVLGVRRWRELVIDRKNSRIFSTGQSPQRAVVLMEEEEDITCKRSKDCLFYRFPELFYCTESLNRPGHLATATVFKTR
jgi:hypothetical protein